MQLKLPSKKCNLINLSPASSIDRSVPGHQSQFPNNQYHSFTYAPYLMFLFQPTSAYSYYCLVSNVNLRNAAIFTLISWCHFLSLENPDGFQIRLWPNSHEILRCFGIRLRLCPEWIVVSSDQKKSVSKLTWGWGDIKWKGNAEKATWFAGEEDEEEKTQSLFQCREQWELFIYWLLKFFLRAVQGECASSVRFDWIIWLVNEGKEKVNSSFPPNHSFIWVVWFGGKCWKNDLWNHLCMNEKLSLNIPIWNWLKDGYYYWFLVINYY